jgi:signal transduction histidine kinase
MFFDRTKMLSGDARERFNNILKRICAILLAIVASQIVIQLVSTPRYYQRVTTGTVPIVRLGSGEVTMSNTLVAAWAAERGMDLQTYALYSIALNLTITVGFAAVAALILWKAHREWFHWFTALVLLFYPTGGLWEFTQVSQVAYRYIALGGLLWPSFLLFLYLFPNGRAVPRWTYWIMGILISAHLVSQALFLVAELFSNTPAGLVSFADQLTLAIPLGFFLIVISQIYRYLRDSTQVERAQIKWFVVLLALMIMLGQVIDWATGTNSNSSESLTESGLRGDIDELLSLFIPVSIGIGILRYRLFDIDIIINRALVYGALTSLVIGLYVVVVGYLGTLVRTENNLIISLAATGLVAVLFQPLRDRLQLGVNRLMYGQRDEPVAVLSQLGARLEGTLIPDQVLPGMLETVSQALKLPYAAIALQVGGQFQIQAERGQASGAPEAFPLIHQGETIGQLLVARRSPGEDFNPADHLLLTNIARQAGTVAHSVRLTAALQQSRQQLVTAREEERRRLRRDLHDGLGPQLASQTLTIEAIGRLLETNAEKARDLLGHLKSQSQTAIQDIRRLVYDLRPPALDELGLAGALLEGVRQYESAGSNVEITTDPEPLPTLPAAVEVAVYRIAQEAITNVLRHSQAKCCNVSITIQNNHLDLLIADDGKGYPANFHFGVGLNSMRERAEELGGTIRFENQSQGGARVQVWLPLLGDEE